MVDPGTAVNLILKAAPAVSALVGTRIYPGPLPDTVIYPAIVRWIIDREEIGTLDPPEASGLVRTEMRLIAVSKNVSIEKAEVAAFAVFSAINDTLRAFGKGYVSNTASPVEKIWVDGISVSRNFQEDFNKTTFAWETSASWDIWTRPTY